MGKKQQILLSVFAIVPLTLLMISGARAQSPPTTPTPSPTPKSWVMPLPVSAHATPAPEGMFVALERLAAPTFSDPPTQVELGHYGYYLSCMVCHGDRGQGLTEEWRSVLDPADRNCWQSKCHAANHPPEGFQLPRTSPPVMGPGSLGSFQTAADLFAYLRTEMPWPFPGLLEEKAYWQLTAYLVDANEIDYGGQTLGPDNASQVLLSSQLVQTHHTDVHLERVVTGIMLALVVGAAILHGRFRAQL